MTPGAPAAAAAPPELPIGRDAWLALLMSTLAYAVCFASWVINAVLVTYLVGQGLVAFKPVQVSWLLAAPILTGAVCRAPIGQLAARFGGRRVLFGLMLVMGVPLFLLTYARGFVQFLLASAGFGLAGGSFAVGVGYVAAWFGSARQGTALGIFGMGAAGAAATTALAPRFLEAFTSGGADPEGWRLLPRAYAAAVVVTALAFFCLAREQPPRPRPAPTLRPAPVERMVVWRLGLYYCLFFGGFVALSQWIISYSINVYRLSLAQAGVLAAAFSLPAGLVRGVGGWLTDRFGARTVMYWVFGSSIVLCLLLAIPRMDVQTVGEGVLAASEGTVSAVTAHGIQVGAREYPLIPRPAHTPAELDQGFRFLPGIARWQEAVVETGQTVQKKELLARGVTNVYYPAHLWFFAVLLVLFGLVCGIGMSGVLKFISEQFPQAVGVVGGMVGVIGAISGFVLPLLFATLIRAVGLWSTCWMVLLLLSLVCLAWLQRVVRRIMTEEAPDLVQLIERRRDIPLGQPVATAGGPAAHTVRALLERIPFFADLTPEAIKHLSEIATLQPVGGGEVIFREGDPGDRLYVIVAGSVRLFRSGPAGNEIEIATLGSGDYFGELALIDGQPRSASAAASEPGELLRISRQEFLARLSSSPRMVADLLVGLAGEIRASDERLSRSSENIRYGGTQGSAPANPVLR